MKKLSIILGIIISIGLIGGSIYRFDLCKASKDSVIELAGDLRVYKLEQYRRYLQERIWAIKAQYPDTYHNMLEYQRLTEELRQIDMKIRAFYNRRGR